MINNEKDLVLNLQDEIVDDNIPYLDPINRNIYDTNNEYIYSNNYYYNEYPVMYYNTICYPIIQQLPPQPNYINNNYITNNHINNNILNVNQIQGYQNDNPENNNLNVENKTSGLINNLDVLNIAFNNLKNIITENDNISQVTLSVEEKSNNKFDISMKVDKNKEN